MERNLVSGRAGHNVMAAMLSGCDYWPPALQTQIEQLRSELQTVTMERAQLQTQMTSVMKAKDDLQAQVNDLFETNRDKSDDDRESAEQRHFAAGATGQVRQSRRAVKAAAPSLRPSRPATSLRSRPRAKHP